MNVDERKLYLVADSELPIVKVGHSRFISERLSNLRREAGGQQCLDYLGADRTPKRIDPVVVGSWSANVDFGAARQERFALAAVRKVAAFSVGEWFVVDPRMAMSAISNEVDRLNAIGKAGVQS